MHKDWTRIADELTANIKDLRGGIPDVMKAFSGLAQTATAAGALDPKTKELIALGISIAARCDGCIAFHVKACVHHGATRAEVAETIGMAIYMGGGPSMVYGAQALEAFDQASGQAAAVAAGA